MVEPVNSETDISPVAGPIYPVWSVNNRFFAFFNSSKCLNEI